LTGLMLFVIGAAGYVFLVGSAVLGGWFFSRALALARTHAMTDARRLFFASIIYLPLLLVLLVLDQPALISSLF
jgi:heme o synthase